MGKIRNWSRAQFMETGDTPFVWRHDEDRSQVIKVKSNGRGSWSVFAEKGSASGIQMTTGDRETARRWAVQYARDHPGGIPDRHVNRVVR